MEEQNNFNEAPREKFFKKIKRLIFSGSAYWIRGGKIGLFILFLFFLICLITAPVFIGLVVSEFLTENILNPILRDVTGIDLSTNVGGMFFSFYVPDVFGWLYLAVIFFLAGSFMGSLIDLIKKRIIILSVFIVLFGLLFGIYLLLAHFSSSPFRCSLLFDGNPGHEHQPKTMCLLNYVISNKKITNSLICDNLDENHNDNQKSLCFTLIAMRTGKPEYCDRISAHEDVWDRSREACYSFLNKKNDNGLVTDNFKGNINDENIKLQYDTALFGIVRNKIQENETQIGYYGIYLENNDMLPKRHNEAEINIKKRLYYSNLDKLESDQNQIMQLNGSTITKVQRIKLGNYEYIKTISKDRVDYIAPFGKIYVSALLDFRYLPQTDENIKKIENLLTSIQYKF